MIARAATYAALAVALGCSGCAGTADLRVDSTSSQPDRGVGSLDGLAFADGPSGAADVRPAGDSGPLKTRDFVVNDVILPTSEAEAKKYGFDFDRDGTIDNALGGLISAIQSFSGNDLAGDLQLSIAKGSTILLIRLFASSFVDHVGTTGRYFIGKDTTCCTATKDLAMCRQQARATCFSGSATFERATSQVPSELSGSISGGRFTLGAAKVPVAIAVGTSQMLVNLSGAVIKGKLESDGSISGGQLAGGVSQAEIDQVLLPAIAQVITAEIKDPGTSQSTRDQLSNLFDSNKDGQVTAAELRGNALVASLIKPDVDVDSDGKRDLSLGLGFSAVGAVIK